MLKKGLRALSMNDDPDDGSLASSYKPQMNTDRSLTFHAPVYPQQNEPEDPDKP